MLAHMHIITARSDAVTDSCSLCHCPATASGGGTEPRMRFPNEPGSRTHATAATGIAHDRVSLSKKACGARHGKPLGAVDVTWPWGAQDKVCRCRPQLEEKVL